MINRAIIFSALPNLLHGAWVSIQVAAISCLIGLSIGIFVAVIQTSKATFLKVLTAIYVTIIRGTPMLIQLTAFFFIFPMIGIKLSAFWCAVITIGLNSSAYVSQIVRSGISAVGVG